MVSNKKIWFCVYFRGAGSGYKLIEVYASHEECTTELSSLRLRDLSSLIKRNRIEYLK